MSTGSDVVVYGRMDGRIQGYRSQTQFFFGLVVGFMRGLRRCMTELEGARELKKNILTVDVTVWKLNSRTGK